MVSNVSEYGQLAPFLSGLLQGRNMVEGHGRGKAAHLTAEEKLLTSRQPGSWT
jgi:hypothetical protein